MTQERLAFIRGRTSLVPLIGHSKLLRPTRRVDGRDHYVVTDLLPAPVDEYGLPCPSAMMRGILGSMATELYVWTGTIDPHHMAHPKADYTVARTPGEGDIGSAFRGLAMHKIELPRQMHDYAHAIFELQKRPSLDTMRQALTEVGHAQSIARIIGIYSVASTPESEDRQRQECLRRVHDALDLVEQPQLGILPAPEQLADMDIEELKAVVGMILSIRRVGDMRIVHPAVMKANYAQRAAA